MTTLELEKQKINEDIQNSNQIKDVVQKMNNVGVALDSVDVNNVEYTTSEKEILTDIFNYIKAKNDIKRTFHQQHSVSYFQRFFWKRFYSNDELQKILNQKNGNVLSLYLLSSVFLMPFFYFASKFISITQINLLTDMSLRGILTKNESENITLNTLSALDKFYTNYDSFIFGGHVFFWTFFILSIFMFFKDFLVALKINNVINTFKNTFHSLVSNKYIFIMENLLDKNHLFYKTFIDILDFQQIVTKERQRLPNDVMLYKDLNIYPFFRELLFDIQNKKFNSSELRQKQITKWKSMLNRYLTLYTQTKESQKQEFLHSVTIEMIEKSLMFADDTPLNIDLDKQEITTISTELHYQQIVEYNQSALKNFLTVVHSHIENDIKKTAMLEYNKAEKNKNDIKESDILEYEKVEITELISLASKDAINGPQIPQMPMPKIINLNDFISTELLLFQDIQDYLTRNPLNTEIIKQLIDEYNQNVRKEDCNVHKEWNQFHEKIINILLLG